MTTRRVLAVGAGAAAAVALGLAAAFVAGAATRVGSGAASFGDPAGDANGAADITALTVGDDPASGMVQFTMTAIGEMTIDAARGPEVNVYVDTDRNPATGSPSGREFTGSPPGAEYRLSYERTATESGGGAESWNGTSWQEAPESATMSFDQSGDTFTWRLSRTDLGATGGFDLYLGSEIFVDHRAIGLDRAPDGGVWSYVLSSVTTTTQRTTTARTAIRPLIGTPTTMPGKAIAGRRFTVVFRVTRSDTRKPLTGGTMTCAPSIRGKVIRHVESFRNGTARLAFTIPRDAKGTLLKVKLTITLGTASTTRLATFYVG